jgi:type I restriction enzyme S subunit
VAREKTEKLRQSIPAKAFSGELVETEAEIARREGREYEAEEVLLERIKTERRKVGKAIKIKQNHFLNSDIWISKTTFSSFILPKSHSP